jgi:hypothetical protein
VLGSVVNSVEMLLLHGAPIEAKATKGKLVPVNGVLLVDMGMDGGGGEAMKGKWGVSKPTIETLNEDI